MPRLFPFLVRAVVVFVVLIAFSPATGATWWQGDPDVPGDWFEPSNWTEGVPTLHVSANIYEGTAVISAGDAEAGSLKLLGDTVELHLDGGTLTAGPMIGYGARMIQTDGVSRNDDLLVGWGAPNTGTYELHGGTILVGGFTYVGGVIGGVVSPGHFIQNGGHHDVGYFLEVAWQQDSVGLYELNSGQITCGCHLEVGGHSGQPWPNHSGSASFVQRGGAVEVAWSVVVYAGVYALEGGEVSAGGVAVLSDPYGEGRLEHSGGKLIAGDIVISGIYEITGASAEIICSEKLLFYGDPVFTAVPGATIRMTGAKFENECTDAGGLSGLANLTLVFEGGQDHIDPCEVAGEDMGAIMAGFENNFALGTLRIGGAGGIGQIQLFDAFDNRPGWDGAEALYVENLFVGPGSHLDLNGLNLYYLNGTIDPGAVLLGGTPILIPAPGSLELLGVGVLTLFRRRRRGPRAPLGSARGYPQTPLRGYLARHTWPWLLSPVSRLRLDYARRRLAPLVPLLFPIPWSLIPGPYLFPFPGPCLFPVPGLPPTWPVFRRRRWRVRPGRAGRR